MPGARPSAGLQPPIELEQPVTEAIGDAGCPHMAILLDSIAEVAPALASFYSLGLRRNGWLFHRSLPGKADEDRQALSAAGLDVEALEREGRLEVRALELGGSPDAFAEPLIPLVDRELRRGYDAVWWSRFPVGPDDDMFRVALQYDRYWDDCFHGRSAVSLCVYIVGGLPADAREQRVDDLRAMHDATLTLEADRHVSAVPRHPGP
jgi:hypothetical protein